MEATQSKLFTWIPFYGELAEKLIPFRSHQHDLIDLLEELRAADLTITPMQDKDASGSRFPLAEIDPFTFFAVFNRQINQDMRIRILRELKPRFAVEAEVPSDFAGVPIVNNQSSWFFSYQPKRLPGDVDTLWRVFELALAPHALEHISFGQSFDEALKVRGTNINLTMGLFWIRPGTFLNLDGVNRQFLGIKLPRNELSFAFYKETIANVRASRSADFPHLSRDAWDAAEDEGGARKAVWKSDTISSGLDYWLVNASWQELDPPDQTDRFLSEGVWENQFADRYLDEVKAMKVGDRIAIKTVSTERDGLPFDTGGRTVTVMRIKAIGTIVSNPGDGHSVEVEWEKPFDPARKWYFFTKRDNVWRLKKSWEHTPALIRFVFHEEPQDFAFLTSRFWKHWELSPDSVRTDEDEIRTDEDEIETCTAYGVPDLLAEGVFLRQSEIEQILNRLRLKKNLILQGAPGVGKTFLAKRLAYALIESKDPARVLTVQFHPSYTYEDFVRGYRPSSEFGKFTLVDGPFLRLCETADNDPDRGYVLIIDEINRGNVSQIFGELMMLVEADKRGRVNSVTPLYRTTEVDQLYVPANLYIIGTMNIADRSLALVDYALRRRFAYLTLEPQFGSEAYREWLKKHGMADTLIHRIIMKMTALNRTISEDPQLGEAFRIGHSFFCPSGTDFSGLNESWFSDVVHTEIRPLLEEYWFDAKEKARKACEELLV